MKLEDIRPAINNSVLLLYRIFAIVSLYAVLAGVLVFGVGSAFYAVSKTWIAPVILSPNDKETLDLTGKTLATQNTVDDLRLDIGKLEDTVVEAKSHQAKLETILPAINAAIAQENRHKRETGAVLAHLDQQKSADVTRTQGALAKVADVDASIDSELKAGLITKSDATQARLAFVKSNGDLTDSEIATTLLKDTIWAKTLPSTIYLDTLHKRAELESQIDCLGIVIDTAQKQIATERAQVGTLDQALKTAKQTPMWAAMQGVRTNVALVPYDNQMVAIEGAPVYDCYLSFVVCRRVGTIKKTFAGEQHAVHPIFKSDLRGFLVQLELTDPDSAKSKTLFVGASHSYSKVSQECIAYEASCSIHHRRPVLLQCCLGSSKRGRGERVLQIRDRAGDSPARPAAEPIGDRGSDSAELRHATAVGLRCHRESGGQSEGSPDHESRAGCL